jgi:non-heme Fe2+,alpha-ketoglutarate-dependent halogenase
VGITAWVALSEANDKSGCMQMIPGSHTDIKDHNDTFGEDNILTRGQEVQGVDGSKGVSTPLNPGQMSIHSARVVHSSQANNSDDRRIGFVIQPYMPPDVMQTLSKSYAQLVRGSDPYGHFNLIDRPKVDMDPSDLAIKEKVNKTWADILYHGAKKRRDY